MSTVRAPGPGPTPARPVPGAEVTLVVMTCEGRGHLLARTIASFDARCDYQFKLRLIGVDGPMSAAEIAVARPEVVIQAARRRGYVVNILSMLRHVDTEFMFWLEDDWAFNAPVNVPAMVDALIRHPDWVQLLLSKIGPLEGSHRAEALEPGILRAAFGFSANPCLVRTAHVRALFEALREAPRAPDLSFENFVMAKCTADGLTCALLDPGDAPAIEHLGYLETTPRQFHMTASLEDDSPLVHVFTLGAPPPLWRRVLMVAKLARALGVVARRQFHDLSAYELAFRIVSLARRTPAR